MVENKDVYRQQAAKIFKVAYKDVTVAQRHKAKKEFWQKVGGTK